MQALPHAPSRGLVARTDALWNKLACPREPTGSLSEAIYSPHTQRLAAGPAYIHTYIHRKGPAVLPHAGQAVLVISSISSRRV